MLLISSLAREASYAGAAGGTNVVASVYGFSGPSGLSGLQSSHTPPQLWIMS